MVTARRLIDGRILLGIVQLAGQICTLVTRVRNPGDPRLSELVLEIQVKPLVIDRSRRGTLEVQTVARRDGLRVTLLICGVHWRRAYTVCLNLR